MYSWPLHGSLLCPRAWFLEDSLSWSQRFFLLAEGQGQAMQRGFNCHHAHSSPEVMLSSWTWCSSRRCEIFVFLKWPLLAQDSLHSAVGCFAYFIASARNSLSSAEWLRLRQMFLHIHRAWWYNWQSSWRGAVCISLCVSPFRTSSSHPCQILLQHHSAFLPASPLLHFGSLFCRAFALRLGTAGRRYRAVQRIKMADVVTPTDLLQPAWAQCSLWHFFH